MVVISYHAWGPMRGFRVHWQFGSVGWWNSGCVDQDAVEYWVLPTLGLDGVDSWP